MKSVYDKEMKSYFNSPVTYAMIGLFLLLLSIFFYVGNLLPQDPDFGSTLQTGEYFLIFFAPIITMKLLAEEKKNKTEVLLLTSPTSVRSIVLGKFFAALTVFSIMLLITLIYPIILSFFGTLPTASLIGNYVGFFFMGVLFIAIGLLASSLSDSQVLSAVVGIVTLFILWFAGSIGQSLGGIFGKILTWISPIYRYESFANGLLKISDIVFYITMSGILVYIAIVNTERKRWKQG